MKPSLLGVPIFLFAVTAFAQAPATGLLPFGSFESSSFDAINRQNLNVNFAIPIVSSPGRGLDLKFAITYNSLIWQQSGLFSWSPVTDQNGSPSWGWNLDSVVGAIPYKTASRFCTPDLDYDYHYYDYAYVDPAGTRHAFSLNFWDRYSGCVFGGATGPRTGYATDGSGYYLDATSPDSPIVWAPSGIAITKAGTMTDTNGNFLSKVVVSSIQTDWKDTTGRTALRIVRNVAWAYGFLDTAGSYQTVTLSPSDYNIKTNFGCPGVSEYTGSASLPYSILLPNGQFYFLSYEATPGWPGYVTGRLQRITLPTGGYYEYDYTGPNAGINCADGTITNLTKVISDGASSATQQFSRVQIDASNWKTTVTAPQLPYDAAANQTTFVFTTQTVLGQALETSQKIYQGSEATGTLLRTVNTAWALNGTPASRTVILENNQTQSKTETDFDTYGILLAVREYDWGTGAPGPLLRTTALTYLPTTALNMRNRLTQRTVRDAAGAVKSRTDIAYDEPAYINTECLLGIAQHNDATYGCTYTGRGNPTSVTSYTDPVTPAGATTQHSYYDFFGNLRRADANCCQQKQWNYSALTQFAYPDSVVSGASPGPQLTTSATYNTYTGRVITATDENGKVTTFTYADSLNRNTQVQRPDGATIIYGYDDPARSASVKIPIQGTNQLVRTTTADTLGRPVKQRVTDAAGASYSTVETQYDPLGRPYRVSNRHNSTAQYWTETRFDALGRPVVTILPDNSQTTYAYSGTTVTVTDPAGKKRQSQVDGLGRLIKVTEPDANGVLNVDTTYAYTTLDALTQVIEGFQTRTYTYDGLGRLLTASTPEANQAAISYQYNYFNLVTQRTDPRGVITTYGYDTLNRLTGVSYNVGTTGVPATPGVTYAYGTDPTQNNNGRLLTMTDGVGSETYSYDILGRTTQVQKVIGGTTYTTGYAYNLASELTSLSYPSGRVVQQTFDAIGRLSTLADAMGTVNTTYASGFTYNPAFQALGFNYGNGVGASFGYSADRMQLTSLSYTKSTQTLFSLNYSYKTDAANCPNAPAGNNGQMQCITDNVDAGRGVKYTYDPLA